MVYRFFLSTLWSVVQVVLIPIALGIVLQIINRKIAEKASTALPIISVVAISLILAIVVGGSKHQILTTGLLIFLVVILHNVLGYTIGYWLARLLKLDRQDQKAVSIEVGMQKKVVSAVSLAALEFPLIGAAVPGECLVSLFIHNRPILESIGQKSYNCMQDNEAVIGPNSSLRSKYRNSSYI